MSYQPPHLPAAAPGENFFHPKSLHFMATSLDALASQQHYPNPPPPTSGSSTTQQSHTPNAKTIGSSGDSQQTIPKPIIEKLPLYTTNVQLIGRVMETMLGFNPAAGPSTVAFADDATLLQTRQTSLYTSSSYFNHHHAASSKEKELQAQQQSLHDFSGTATSNFNNQCGPNFNGGGFGDKQQHSNQTNYHSYSPNNAPGYNNNDHSDSAIFNSNHPPTTPPQPPFYFNSVNHQSHQIHPIGEHPALLSLLSPHFDPSFASSHGTPHDGGGNRFNHSRSGVGIHDRTYPANNHPYNGRHHQHQQPNQSIPNEPNGPVYLYNPSAPTSYAHNNTNHHRNGQSSNHNNHHYHQQHQSQPQQRPSQPAHTPRLRFWDRLFSRQSANNQPLDDHRGNNTRRGSQAQYISTRNSGDAPSSFSSLRQNQSSLHAQNPSNTTRHNQQHRASHLNGDLSTINQHRSQDGDNSCPSSGHDQLPQSFCPLTLSTTSATTPISMISLRGSGWRSFFPTLGDYVEMFAALNQNDNQQHNSSGPVVSAQQLALERFELDQDYIKTLVKYGILPPITVENGRLVQSQFISSPCQSTWINSTPTMMPHQQQQPSTLTTTQNSFTQTPTLVSSPFVHTSAIVMPTYPSPLLLDPHSNNDDGNLAQSTPSTMTHPTVQTSENIHLSYNNQLNSANITSFHDLYNVQQRMLQTVYNNSAFVQYHEWKRSEELFSRFLSGSRTTSNLRPIHDRNSSSQSNDSNHSHVTNLTLDVGVLGATPSNSSRPQASLPVPATASYTIFGGQHLSNIAGSLITPRQPMANPNLFFNPTTPTHHFGSIYNNLLPCSGQPTPTNAVVHQTPRDYQFSSQFGRPAAAPKDSTLPPTSTLNPNSIKADTYSILYGHGTLNLDNINVNTVPTHTDRLRCTLTALRQKENHNLVMLEPYFARLFAGKPSCIDRSDGVASITPRKLAPLMTQSKTTYRERIIAMKQSKLKLYQMLLPWSILVQDGLNVLSLQHELNQLQLNKLKGVTNNSNNIASSSLHSQQRNPPPLKSFAATNSKTLQSFSSHQQRHQQQTARTDVKPNTQRATSSSLQKFKSMLNSFPMLELLFHPPAVLKWTLLPSSIYTHNALLFNPPNLDYFSPAYTRGIAPTNPVIASQLLLHPLRLNYPQILSPQTPIEHHTPYLDRFILPQWLLKTSKGHRKEATAWKYLFITPEPLEHFVKPTTSTTSLDDCLFHDAFDISDQSQNSPPTTSTTSRHPNSSNALWTEQIDLYNRHCFRSQHILPLDCSWSTPLTVCDMDWISGDEYSDDTWSSSDDLYQHDIDHDLQIQDNHLSHIDVMTDSAFSESSPTSNISAALQTLGHNLTTIADDCFTPPLTNTPDLGNNTDNQSSQSGMGANSQPGCQPRGGHFDESLDILQTTAHSRTRHSNTELYEGKLGQFGLRRPQHHRIGSATLDMFNSTPTQKKLPQDLTLMIEDEKDDASFCSSPGRRRGRATGPIPALPSSQNDPNNANKNSNTTLSSMKSLTYPPPEQLLSPYHTALPISTTIPNQRPRHSGTRLSSLTMATLADNEALIQDDYDISCVALPTQDQIDSLYHRENALGCSHYERACHIAATCCSRFYCCRYCHDAAEQHAIVRKNIEQIVCMYCVLDLMEAESQVSAGLHRLYEPAKHIFLSSVPNPQQSTTTSFRPDANINSGRRLAPLNEAATTRNTSTTQFIPSPSVQNAHGNISNDYQHLQTIPNQINPSHQTLLSPQPGELFGSYDNFPTSFNFNPVPGSLQPNQQSFPNTNNHSSIAQIITTLGNIPLHTSLPPQLAAVSVAQSSPARPASGANNSDSIDISRRGSGGALGKSGSNHHNTDLFAKDEAGGYVPLGHFLSGDDLPPTNSHINDQSLVLKKMLNQLVPKSVQIDNYELSLISSILLKVESLVSHSHFMHTQHDFNLNHSSGLRSAQILTSTRTSPHNSLPQSNQNPIRNGQLTTMSKPLHRIAARQTCITDLIAPDLVVPGFASSSDQINSTRPDDTTLILNTTNNTITQIDPFTTIIDPNLTNIDPFQMRDESMTRHSSRSVSSTHYDITHQLDHELTTHYTNEPFSPYYNATAVPSTLIGTGNVEQPLSPKKAAQSGSIPPSFGATNSPIKSCTVDHGEQLNAMQKLEIEQTRLEQERLAVFYHSVSALQDRLTSGMELIKAGIEYLHQLPGATQKNDMVVQLQRFLTIAKHPNPNSISTILSSAAEQNRTNSSSMSSIDGKNNRPGVKFLPSNTSIPQLDPAFSTNHISNLSTKTSIQPELTNYHAFNPKAGLCNDTSMNDTSPDQYPPRFLDTLSNTTTLTTSASIVSTTMLSVVPPPQSLEDNLSVLTNSIIDMYSAQIEPLPNPKPITNHDDCLFGDDDIDQPVTIPFLAPIAANTLRNTWHGNNAGYDITFLNNLGSFFISRAQYYQLFSVILMQPLKQLLLDVSVYLEVLLGSRLRPNTANNPIPQPSPTIQTGSSSSSSSPITTTDSAIVDSMCTSQLESHRTNLSSVCTPKTIKLSKIEKTITPTYYTTTSSLTTQIFQGTHMGGNAMNITNGINDVAWPPHGGTTSQMMDEDIITATTPPSQKSASQSIIIGQISSFLRREHSTIRNLLDFTIQMDAIIQGYVISVLSKAKIHDSQAQQQQQQPPPQQPQQQPQQQPPPSTIIASFPTAMGDAIDTSTGTIHRNGIITEPDERFTIFDYYQELSQLQPPTNNPNLQTNKPDYSPYSIIPQSAVPLLPSYHLALVYSHYAAQSPFMTSPYPRRDQPPTQMYPGSDHSEILPWSYSLGDLDHLFLQFYNPPASASLLPNCKIKLPNNASQSSIPILTNTNSYGSSALPILSNQGSLDTNPILDLDPADSSFNQHWSDLFHNPQPITNSSSLPLGTIFSPANTSHTILNHSPNDGLNGLDGFLENDPTTILPLPLTSETDFHHPPQLPLLIQTKFINTSIISLRLSQPPNQSCGTCLRALARVYCDCCRLYDDKRGKAVTHCSLCSICRQGIPSLLTHCMKCDVCYNKRTLRSWFAEGKSGNVHMRNSMIASRCGRIYASLRLTYPNDFDFTLTKGVEDTELLQTIHERDQRIISKLEFWDYSWLPSTVIEKLFHNCPFTPPSSNSTSRFSFGMGDDDSSTKGNGDDLTDESILFDPSTNAHVRTNTSSAVSFAKHDLDGSNTDERDMNKVDITRRLNLIDNTYTNEFKHSMVSKYYPYLGQRKHENSFYSIIEAYQREQSVEKPGLKLPNQNELTFPQIPLMLHKETHPIYNPLLRIRAKHADAKPNLIPTASQSTITSTALQQQFSPSQPTHDDGFAGLPMLLPTTITSDIQQRFVDTDDNLTYPHICITSIMSTSCFICLQPLSQGNATISTLSCSHVLHSSCLKSFLQNNGTKCFCRKSISANPLYSNQIENYLRSDPHGLIPNTEATISCNDCEISFNVTSYHCNFNRCSNCTSFNTFIANVGRRLSATDETQPTTLADLLQSASPNNNGARTDNNNI